MNSLDDVGSMVNWTYGHDANGNLTSRSDGTDTWRYTWDDENRLIQVEKNSTTQASYQYDSNSRLIQRVAAGTTTNYTWDGWDLVKEEKSGTITETTRYAVPQGMVTSFDRNGSRYYLHGDGLSSTQLVTDGNGAQAARVVYGAWGDTLSSNDSVPGGLDVRFVGGLGVRNDATTGLIYMRHRWYDAGVLGRFISQDPIGFSGGLNLYAYGNNNPVTFVDWTGLLSVAEIMEKVVLGKGARKGDRERLRKGLEELERTCTGKEILDGLTDENFKSITLVRGGGSWGSYGTHKVQIDMNLNEVTLYAGPDNKPKLMGLKESAGYSTEKAVALSAGHEFGHLLGVGDFVYRVYEPDIKLPRMRNVMKHDNPLRRELGLPTARIAYGKSFKCEASGMSDTDVIRYIRRQ